MIIKFKKVIYAISKEAIRNCLSTQKGKFVKETVGVF